MTNLLDNLEQALKPNDPSAMPDGPAMLKFARDVLKKSEIGMRLITVWDMEEWKINVITTPDETTYIPTMGQGTVGVCQKPQTPPARFVLLLVLLLRELEQNFQGNTQANIKDPAAEQVRIAMEKQGDKVAHVCAVAYELNEVLEFTEYRFLDEVRNMGYAESMETFLTNL